MKTLAESIFAICYQKYLYISYQAKIKLKDKDLESLSLKNKLIHISEWFKDNDFSSKLGYVDIVEIQNCVNLIDSYLSVASKLGT
jgi:hypothetical protein